MKTMAKVNYVATVLVYAAIGLMSIFVAVQAWGGDLLTANDTITKLSISDVVETEPEKSRWTIEMQFVLTDAEMQALVEAIMDEQIPNVLKFRKGGADFQHEDDEVYFITPGPDTTLPNLNLVY